MPFGRRGNAWTYAWVLALALTALLILYGVAFGPSRLVLAAQTRGNQVDVRLFGVLFYAWITVLLVLLHGTARGKTRRWAAPSIVLIFLFGFLSFWIVGTPYGRHSDEWLTMAQARLILERGRISVPNPLYAYLYYPGTQTLAAILAAVFGEGFLVVRRLLLLTTGTAFATLLFVWQRRLLHSDLMAGLGSLIFIAGNSYATKSYVLFPGHIGLILLLLYFVFIFGSRPSSRSTSSALWLPGLIISAITVTHFMSSVLALTTTYLMLVLGWRQKEASNARQLAVLSTVLFLAWQVGNVYVVRSFAGLVPGLFRSLWQAEPSLGAVTSLAEMTVGAEAPVWTRVNILFWIATLYIMGSVAVLKTALRFRSAPHAQQIEFVGLASASSVAIFAGLASPGGSQLLRLLQWIPIFSVSGLLRSIAVRRSALALASILLGVFSLASFLQFNNNIPADSFSIYEVRSGQFLEQTADTSGEAHYVTGVHVRPLYQYYLGSVLIASEPEYTYFRDAGDMFRAMDDLAAQFHTLGGDGYFVLADRMVTQYLRLYQLGKSDPRWHSLATLSRHHEVYDNGTVRVFFHAMQQSLAPNVLVR